MKKFLVFLFIAGFIFSCGGDEKKVKEETKKDITGKPDYKKGLALVAKNKCLTCHAIDEKITGPPYREISKKYNSYSDTIVSHLASKIISGGNGVWGEIFMTPHPGVTKKDAETMVRYILLLSGP